MKMLMALTLVLFGAVWSYYATLNASMMKTRATSDAMQLEAELKGWALDKVSESDLLEIFPDNHSLRFGGESKDKNFRMMIKEIAVSSAPPVWPGIAALMIGLVGVFSSFHKTGNKNPDQAGRGDGDKPSN